MPRARRRAAFALLLAASVALAPAPAGAQEAEPEPRDQIVLSGTVNVRRGEDVGEVVVLHGTVAVAGVARGDVVVIDGEVAVTGQVSGSVVSINGPVTIGRDAQIGGDVIARDPVRIAEGALIGGEVREGTAFTFRTPVAVFGPFAAWLALAASTLVLGAILLLVAPRGAEAVALTARGAPWSSLGWGLAVSFGLPVLGVLALLSLVGLPFGLGVLFALLLLYAVGFAWSAFGIGRTLWREPRSRWLAFLMGWAAVAAVAAIPWVGGFVWFAGAVYGVGAMTVATWRARSVGGRHRPRARVLVAERSMEEEGTGI
ncbi:MAG TPA: hypothetical protein VF029_06310 [Actinomycetota bacterium]